MYPVKLSVQENDSMEVKIYDPDCEGLDDEPEEWKGSDDGGYDW